MKRFVASILVISLLTLFCACGKQATDTDSIISVPYGNTDSVTRSQQTPPANTDAPANPDNRKEDDFRSCAAFYKGMTDALTIYVDVAVGANNERIMNANPSGYESDPAYLPIIYAPFASGNLDFFASLGSTTEEVRAAIEEIGFFNVEYDRNSMGEHSVRYCDEDDSGEVITIEELAAYQNSSIRFERRENGRTIEFSEFIWLGGDMYALQNMHERAIIEYDGKMIKSFTHAQNRFSHESEETGEPYSWSVKNTSDTDSIWGRTDMDEAWVLQKSAENGIYMVFELNDGTLSISGYNQIGSDADAKFEAMEQITIEG